MEILALMEMVEKAKDECLIDIPEDSQLLEHINEMMINHGVMRMFYNLSITLSKMQEEKINERMAG